MVPEFEILPLTVMVWGPVANVPAVTVKLLPTVIPLVDNVPV